MTKKPSLPEVLAPVGNEEMLVSAVRAGADAVYLGTKNFNARRNADNFDLAALKDAIDYCHIRSVKVYLTLNILISDNEIESAYNLAKEAYLLGIDGIIIADLGLIRLLHSSIPSLELHASTQMTVYDKDSLKILKDMGIKRVVAAREMSKNELTLLCKEAAKLEMEIEVFVHGALCMCLSGQCLMSAVLGGRSGNRGLCAGPCRLPFSDDFGNDNVLSLKDLSLLDYVNELKQMGVASIKIEGRMKRPEYVAAATNAFRTAVDGNTPNEVKKCLENVFSRSGFTDGYYTEKKGKNMFGIRTKDDSVLSKEVYPFLHSLVRHERQSVPIKITSKILENKPISITVSDGKNEVSLTADIPEKAINKPLTREVLKEQLEKLGSTPYFAQDTEIFLDKGLTVKLSVINTLRRNAVALLNEKRCKNERSAKDFTFNPAKPMQTRTPKIWIRAEKAELLPENLSDVDSVILPIENIQPLYLNENISKIAELPKACLVGKPLKELLFKAKQLGFSKIIVQNTAQLDMVKEAGLFAIAGAGLNIYSSHSCITARQMGFSKIILSYEMTNDMINSMQSDLPTVFFAYGRLPLMVTKNCPVSFSGCQNCNKDRKITDRKGISFPVRCRFGYSEIYGDRPVWLGDKLHLANADFALLYFTNETKERAQRVLDMYRNKQECDVPFTRGMFFRGVE